MIVLNSFIDSKINEKNCIKYLIGILAFIIIVIIFSAYEMLIPKSFNTDLKPIEFSENSDYVVNIENISKSKVKLSISGYAFKGPDAIEIFNSYYILKNKETGKMYKLKTKMEQRGNFKGTGVEFSGMHSQAITLFMQKGNYELYIWYDNNNENKLLNTGLEIKSYIT